MNLEELNKELEKKGLNKDQLLNLINVEKLDDKLEASRKLDHKLNTSIGDLSSRLDNCGHSLDASIGALRDEMNTSIRVLKGENTYTRWVIGIVGIVGAILASILAHIFFLRALISNPF